MINADEVSLSEKRLAGDRKQTGTYPGSLNPNPNPNPGTYSGSLPLLISPMVLRLCFQRLPIGLIAPSAMN